MGRLLSDRVTRAESRSDIRRTRDDGLAHDARSPAAEDRYDPTPLHQMRSEHKVSNTKGDAAYEATEAVTAARTRQEDASRIYDHKCNEAAATEMPNKTSLEKAEELTKLIEAQSDFFQTVLERHEEVQNLLNARSTQLNAAVSAADHAPKNP